MTPTTTMGSPLPAPPLAPHSAPHHATGNLQALSMSFLVIVVSEIGDKTFLIAAVLAMRNPRILIFSAAMSALLVMTVLSALLGQILPSILSKQYTQLITSLLFIGFGARLLRDGWLMSDNEGEDELAEVTHELEDDAKATIDAIPPVPHKHTHMSHTHEPVATTDIDNANDSLYDTASGTAKFIDTGVPLPKRDIEARSPLVATPGSRDSRASSSSIPSNTFLPTPPVVSDHPIVAAVHRLSLLARRAGRAIRASAAHTLSPVWVQAFVLTFLAEWGDRSQIATVALAGAEDFWWVTIGGLAGHALCSGIAVIGGRMLAERISVRVVTIIGAVLFILCGVIGFYEFYQHNYVK